MEICTAWLKRKQTLTSFSPFVFLNFLTIFFSGQIRSCFYGRVDVDRDKQKTHLCPSCEKTFGLAGNLLKHVRAVHDREKPYKCSKCHLRFSNNYNLCRHIRLIHVNDKKE